MLRRVVLLATILALCLAIAQPAAAQRGKVHQFENDISDPEVFLQPLKMIGRSSGVIVYWVFDQSECFYEDGSPVPNCHVMPAQPAQASATDVDPNKMVIPAKVIRDGLVIFVRQNTTIYLENDTSNDDYGRFVLRPMLTFYSDAFLDPRCTDPATGLPCNGQLTLNMMSRRITRLMHSSEWFEDSQYNTRQLYISRALLLQYMPAEVADNFFNGEIGIRMSIFTQVKLGSAPFADAWYLVMGH